MKTTLETNFDIRPLTSSFFRAGGRLFFLVFVAIFAACTNELPAPSEIADSGFVVDPAFQDFYNQYGGERVFGDPISVGFLLEEDGPLLQYFQTMRLEYDDDPTLSEANRISLFPLGEWDLPAPENQTPWPGVDSGLTVQGNFLDFYETNDGALILGPPISPELDRDGTRVQYFRNGRLEWVPELPDDQSVFLSFLGEAHFRTEMSFVYREALSKQFVPAVTVTSVDVFASVRHPVLYLGEEQDLNITILTPDGRSVSGLSVNIAVDYGGRREMIDLELAENQNKVQTTLDFDNTTAGQQIELLISVQSPNGDLLGSDRVSFKTWW